jgi:Holliday junction resolvase RusA-like endonuclease
VNEQPTADDVFGPMVAPGQVPAPVVVLAPQRARKAAPEKQPQPSNYAGPIEFVIFGEPASKANSRELAMLGARNMDVVVGRNDDGSPKLEKMKVGGRIHSRKSDKALQYEENALRQIPPKARLQLTMPVAVTLRIFYGSERPDLDESIVLDVMQNRYKTVEHPTRGKERVLIQAGVYVNDRQVREKHVFHGTDKLRPRTEVRIESISPQEQLL